MGISLKWIGVKAGDQASVLERLGFEVFGESSDMFNAELSCAKLPNGWLILVDLSERIDVADCCAKLASDGLVLGCHVNDVAMFSSAQAFRGGKKNWAVIRDSGSEAGDVEIEGEPPAQIDEFKKRLEAKEEAGDGSVDYLFDLPIDLAGSLSGFSPNKRAEVGWAVVRRTGSRSNGPASPHSLTDAMRAELLPILSSSGWKFANERPVLSEVWEIFREIGDQRQSIYFDFLSGIETYINVHFQTTGPRPSGLDHEVLGIIPSITEPTSFWKRVASIWASPPADPAPVAIKSALESIAIAEAFLETDERSPRIRLYRGVETPGA